MERLSSSYSSNNAFDAIGRLNPAQLSQFIQNDIQNHRPDSGAPVWRFGAVAGVSA
jgi:hypothetical protein